MKTKSKKVLVIGGAGFLGSHIADNLTDKGYIVTIYDQLESKYLNNNQKMIIGDIKNKKTMDKAIKDSDYVFHFAGVADIAESIKNPVITVENNILATSYILDSCIKHKVKKIIFASTIYVYSELGSFYRCTKQACEILIENYYQEFGLEYNILRYGSLYGHRANKFNFIYQIINQALKEGKITRKGDGNEIRDYIHVLDAAEASVDIFEKDISNSHVIIKGVQTIKVSVLLNMLSEMFDNKVQIEYLPQRSYKGHYELTPYSFKPKVAKNFTLNNYHDLGQGLLECIYNEYEKIPKKKRKINLQKIG